MKLFSVQSIAMAVACLFVFSACSDNDDPPQVQHVQTYLFWTSRFDKAIGRATLDTPVSMETIYDNTDGVEGPVSLATDGAAGLIYWTDAVSQQILRAPWDGSGVPEVLYTSTSEHGGPQELVLDAATQQLYWTQLSDNLILRAPADGRGPVDTLFTEADGMHGAWGIGLNVTGDHLYWVEYVDIEVHRSRTDGSEAELLYAGGSGILRPYGLVVDESANTLYIADNPLPGAGRPDRIMRGSADGKATLEILYSFEDGVDNAYTLALDRDGGMLYWHNQLTRGGIWRAPASDTHGVAEEIVSDIPLGQGLAIGRYSYRVPAW